MKKYTVELTAREWQMIRLSVEGRYLALEEKGSAVAKDYDALSEKLYDDSNYKPVEC